MNGTVLIIDDEEPIRKLLSRIIGLEGYDVMQAATLAAGKKILQQKDIDVIVCDVKLPDGNGVSFITQTKLAYPQTETILLTAYGTIADGVTAIKNGAFDYIIKGDDNNKIIPLLERASEKVALAKRVTQLEKQVGTKYSFDAILGKSKSILAAIELAKKVAATDTTVLLLGETGTGKEVFAQAIHHASNRRHKNFVAINCSAFSKDLLENELFGHKAGAFTGAIKDQKGLFEEAHNGTLLLDEVGELSTDLQAKLLRVLETGEYLRLGETRPVAVNTRVIAATNRHLEKEIETGHFRSDLFYRLAAFQITLPSLRERINDIEELTQYFIRQFSVRVGKKIKSATPEFINVLKTQEWKGNIRELKNIIERSIILSDEEELTVDTLPYELRSAGHSPFPTFELATVEKNHIQKVLLHTRGNKTETARLLGIGLTTLYRKIEEYKLT